MSLIFKKKKRTTNFFETHKMIAGLGKIGKSTFASYLKDGEKEPLFADFEDGTKALEVYSARITDFEGFLKFLDYCESNLEEVKKQHSCLVIDTAKKLDEAVEKYLLNKYKVKSIADIQEKGNFGKGWQEYKKLLRDTVNRIMAILPTVFIAHTVDKKLIIKGSEQITQVPDLGKQLYAIVNGDVDLIMWISPAPSGSTVSEVVFNPSGVALGGCRFPNLIGANLEIDHSDMEGSVKRIAEVFNKGA